MVHFIEGLVEGLLHGMIGAVIYYSIWNFVVTKLDKEKK
tara:strand:+ start:2472 stop:2588 length:117 start_codon:yes stop_codon:yes gene_type:complete